MTDRSAGTPAVDLAKLLQAIELVSAGRPVPQGMPAPKRLAKLSRGGWLILSLASKETGEDAGALKEAAGGCPVLELADAEPPRLFGIFRRSHEPAVRWAAEGDVERAFMEDPVATARSVLGHPALAARLATASATVRSRSVPGKLRRPPKSQRYLPPTPSREALLNRVDRSLVERYAQEEAAQERRRRPPKSPLRFSDGYPAKDLSSAIRLLVSAPAAEVAERMRSGTLAGWFREEAGEADLAAVVEAAAHAARERRADDLETRALLLRYIRRTPVGADLERGLIEPMAEALRSRDGGLVASTAEALLLLDSDMAAAELASALFETEVSGRGAVLEALGETGSPRAVNALERLAKAATRAEDREGALRALRRLASEGSARDVARSALERLGEPSEG
jgi:hypothetical protein